MGGVGMRKTVGVRSMTGFAKSSRSANSVTIDVELRALNSRYLEVYFRGLRLDGHQEKYLRDVIKQKHFRGKIEVAVAIAFDASAPLVDESQFARVDNLVAAYTTLCKRYGAKGDGLTEFISALVLSGQGETDRRPEMTEVIQESLYEVIEEASELLSQSRQKEGAGLCEDVSRRLGEIGRVAGKISGVNSGLPEAIRAKLGIRLKLLESEIRLDPSRLEQEALLLADRADVSEELARLKIHLDRCMLRLQSSDFKAIGRELDFIVQEIGREINTIGSKIQDAEVQGMVIDAKSELEKIREQVQNIE